MGGWAGYLLWVMGWPELIYILRSDLMMQPQAVWLGWKQKMWSDGSQ